MSKLNPWARRIGLQARGRRAGGRCGIGLAEPAAPRFPCRSARRLRPTAGPEHVWPSSVSVAWHLGSGPRSAGWPMWQQVAEGQVFGAALLADGTVDTWATTATGARNGRIASETRLTPAPVPGP